MEIWKPDSTDQVVEAIAWAAAEETPLALFGRNSKAGLGRPVQAAHSLDLSGLTGITLYEPEELVLSARVGTPLAEIEAVLGEQGQILAFEPADFGPLLGSALADGSIGGALACNLAGPRRFKAGAARDHFLGLEAVSGRGEAFKSGGRVVKNVTGYDLCKLLAGSYGTLAALTDVTVKVLPAPEKAWSVLIFGLEPSAAVAAMTAALTSSHEVSAATYLPAIQTAKSAVSYVAEAGASVTALRVEGPGPSVEYRAAALRKALADFGPNEELHSHNSRSFWREIRDVVPLQERAELVWRISVPPQAAPAVLQALEANNDFLLDWGGGLVWLGQAASEDGGAARIRAALEPHGGHATLYRAPETLRAALDVFQPQPAAKAALSQRVKAAFDPHGILNPGRLWAGS